MEDNTGKSCFWLYYENVEADKYITTLEHIFETNDNVTYICGQLEKGTHLHCQCYIQLKISKPLSWMKNNISPTASFRIQYKKASADDGRHYCSKPHEGCEKELCCKPERENPTVIPDTFVEYGEIRDKGEGAGRRTDLDAIITSVKEGKNERAIMESPDTQWTYANYPAFFNRARMLYRPPPIEGGVDLRLYVGESGAGKTRKAFSIDPDYYDVPVSNGTLWFDGYDQNKVLIFDDFAGKVDRVTLVSTLKLFDRYVRAIPFKGGFTWLRSPIVVVTSNYHPRYWYAWKDREKSYKAMCRRFRSVTVFEEPRDDEYEEIVFNTRQEIRDYFYDRDQWPTMDIQNEPIGGRIGFEPYE